MQEPNERQLRAAEKFFNALVEMAMEGQPNTPTEFMKEAGPAEPEEKFTAIVEGEACDCGGRDGVIVRVVSGGKVPPRHDGDLLLTNFYHKGTGSQIGHAYLGIEAAKQLVNRIGDAITFAERLKAEKGAG